MTFFQILDSLLLQPLQLLFEVVYVNANRVIGNPGLSIIVLSLVMNFLVLPLYMRADALQEEERDMEARLHRGVTHIKKTFRGDEKMMILQTYYRQNHYKPTYVLRSAVSLFLEIPFFIAAYRFLSGLELIKGVSFGPIADLGAADGLIAIAGVHINLLPIIMTAVNLVSCVIFTKGATPKTKIQLYVMAVFFLFFLYTSPAGLVFYWTLNNIFSLIKTIFYKLKHPGRVLKILAAVAGAALLALGLVRYSFSERPVVKAALLLLGAALMLPLIVGLIRTKKPATGKPAAKPNAKIFFGCAAFLALFIGGYIPASVISSSAQEFVNVQMYYSPIWFVINSLCLAIGTFVIWFGIFYWLASPKGKVAFEKVLWILVGVAIVDFMFFGKHLGVLSSALRFENGMHFASKELWGNLLAVAATAGVMYLLYRYLNKHVFKAALAFVLAIAIMLPINIGNIHSQITNIRQSTEASDSVPEYTMSKTGKNVIVLMLDRAVGAFLPYIFNEKPELQAQFDGFTAYTNVISTGAYTNFGTPALMGGYEYTVDQINLRKDEKLVDKHNEALKVMPVLFDQNGFDVTVFDPIYANYQWVPDLSVFSDYPDIHPYITFGAFESGTSPKSWISANMRNFFGYSLMKACPVPMQSILYDNGNYNRSTAQTEEGHYVEQTITSPHTATGVGTGFLMGYHVLTNLPTITQTTKDGDNTFLFMTNDTTHSPVLLQEPDYSVSGTVDNTEYDKTHADRFTVDGKSITMEEDVQFAHYDSNMASLMQLGKWFDYMRENGVYDNTRIILVADHGRNLHNSDDYILDDGTDTEYFFPLLMVKDFNAEGFSFSDEFMTTADVPTLATSGVITNPTNPFTGNAINANAKYDRPFYAFYPSQWDAWDTSKNNGNQFFPGVWYRIDNQNARDKHNWVQVGENAVLPDALR